LASLDLAPTAAPADALVGATDLSGKLGAQQIDGYHIGVRGLGFTDLAGEMSFWIESFGGHDWTLGWADRTGGPSLQLDVTITSDGVFDTAHSVVNDPIVDLRSSATELSFSTTSQSKTTQLEILSSADPIYVDIRVNGARSGFFFHLVDADDQPFDSAFDPVALVAP